MRQRQTRKSNRSLSIITFILSPSPLLSPINRPRTRLIFPHSITPLPLKVVTLNNNKVGVIEGCLTINNNNRVIMDLLRVNR